MAKVVAIVAARLSSQRLPGKVLLDIAGHPMIWHVVNRVCQAQLLDHVLLAVPDGSQDGDLRAYCNGQKWDFYAGSWDDVLDRYYRAALYAGADVVVRVTGDCPLIDSAVIDETVRWFDGPMDYASNLGDPFICLDPEFPDGLDVEAFSMALLSEAYRKATKTSDREHVTPWMREHAKRIGSVRCMAGDLSHHRWCVDEQQDLDFVRAVYAEMGDAPFGMQDVLNLLVRKPELAAINAGQQRNAKYLAQVEEERHE